MKNILTKTSWHAALAGLLVVAASGTGLYFAVAQDTAPVSQGTVPVFDASNTNSEASLENAPGKLVSSPDQALPASIDPQSLAAEIVKLAQAGVDENVMLAFIASSTNQFNLGSDAIVYLNDIGVPSTVVTAMIQHDQGINPNVAAAPPANPATYAQTSGVIPTVTAPLAAVEQAPPQVNVTYSYFYDSLSPYGNWIDVQGYGLCWQPTAVVLDRGWQPYSNRGRWLHSDAGWYWASDYSWGWAPFHYGRWFRHGRWGWCWAPDTTWGPSWVSWRYENNYAGWAPLPPTARYSSGIGFTYYGRGVSVGFDFGIRADCYTFVPFNRFCDPHPFRHRISRDHVTRIYNKTVIVNNIRGNNNTIINNGIPFQRVAAASPTPIRSVSIRESSVAPSRGHARPERLDPSARTLTVYRPQLPQATTPSKSPFVGAGVQADPKVTARRASQFSPGARTESARTTERNSTSLPDRGQKPAANPTPVVNRSPGASQPDKQNETQQNRSGRGRDQQTFSTRNAVPNNTTPVPNTATPVQPAEQKAAQNPTPVVIRSPGASQPDKQNETQQNRSGRGRDQQSSFSTRNAVPNNATPVPNTATPVQPADQKAAQNPTPVIIRRSGSTVQPPQQSQPSQQSQQTVVPRNTYSRPERNQTPPQTQPSIVVPAPNYTPPEINRPVTRTERTYSPGRQQDAPTYSPRQERPQQEAPVQSSRSATVEAPSRSEESGRSSSRSSESDRRSTDSEDRGRSGRDPRNR